MRCFEGVVLGCILQVKRRSANPAGARGIAEAVQRRAHGAVLVLAGAVEPARDGTSPAEGGQRGCEPLRNAGRRLGELLLMAGRRLDEPLPAQEGSSEAQAEGGKAAGKGKGKGKEKVKKGGKGAKTKSKGTGK